MGQVDTLSQQTPRCICQLAPLPPSLCFRLQHPQTQQKSTILTSSKVSQKKVSFMGGIISHVAVTKLCTQNILYSDKKYFLQCKNKTPDHTSVIAHRAVTLADHSQEKLLKNTLQIVRCCYAALSLGVMTHVPTYPRSQLAPLTPTACSESLYRLRYPGLPVCVCV